MNLKRIWSDLGKLCIGIARSIRDSIYITKRHPVFEIIRQISDGWDTAIRYEVV